jgi:Kef-type K+ transport system membrane component KefB
VSLGSVSVPFGLGTLLAIYLLRQHPASHGLAFVLFLGTAMSVTAFPVLARILHDRGMTDTPLGGLALASAAVGDLIAWSMLAVVVVVLGGNGQAQWHILLVVPFVALVFVLLRPLLARLATSGATQGMFAVVLAGLLVCSALTEWMGLHFIFGAFLFGLIMPRAGAADLRAAMTQRIEQVSRTLLLPVYFVVAGLQVDLSHIGATGLGEFGLIMVVAVGGKFTGTFTAARLHHIEPRRAAALGTLMNSRGLTELVILTTGRQLGLLDGDLYSLMVLMAIVTTVMAGPLLRLWYPREDLNHDIESSSRAVIETTSS